MHNSGHAFATSLSSFGPSLDCFSGVTERIDSYLQLNGTQPNHGVVFGIFLIAAPIKPTASRVQLSYRGIQVEFIVRLRDTEADQFVEAVDCLRFCEGIIIAPAFEAVVSAFFALVSPSEELHH